MRAHLLDDTEQIVDVPMLDEFAVGYAPDRNPLPGEFLAGRREDRRAGRKLYRVIMRRRDEKPRDNLVVRDDAVLDGTMEIGKHLEVVLVGGLHSGKSLPLVGAVLDVAVRDDILQCREIAIVDVGEIRMKERGIGRDLIVGVGALYGHHF